MPINLQLPELSEDFAGLTGEDVRIPRLDVPQISISYKDVDDEGKAEGEVKGGFVQYDPITKDRTSLGKTIEIQILHHRQSLSAYAETEQFFTPEASMKAPELSLFRSTSTDGGKRSVRFIAKGPMKALREQYQNLSYRRILYVLHEGVLKSMVMKGASFGGFIELTKALHGKSSSSVQLEVSTEKGKKGTVTYYAMKFKPTNPVDAEEIKPVLAELSAWFAKHDALVDAQQKDRAQEAAIARGDAPLPSSESIFKPGQDPRVAKEVPENEGSQSLFPDEEESETSDNDLAAAGL